MQHTISNDTHTRRPRLSALLIALSSVGAFCACAVADRPEQLGLTNGSLTGATAAEGADTPADFVGRWRGQAQDLLELASASGEPAPSYRFPSGSSDITLELNVDEYGILTGTLVFGTAPAPLARDSLASYPPGTSIEDYDIRAPALEGAKYSLSSVLFASEVAPENRVSDGSGSYQGRAEDLSLAQADGILRLYYSTSDAYAAWCGLQPALPSPVEPGLYNCLGAKGVTQATDGKCYTFNDDRDFYPPDSATDTGVIPDPAREVPCARSIACMDQCTCIAPDTFAASGEQDPPGFTPCGQGGAQSDPAALWIRRVGDALIGAFTGAASFVNARGARTTLGQVQFGRLPPP